MHEGDMSLDGLDETETSEKSVARNMSGGLESSRWKGDLHAYER